MGQNRVRVRLVAAISGIFAIAAMSAITSSTASAQPDAQPAPPPPTAQQPAPPQPSAAQPPPKPVAQQPPSPEWIAQKRKEQKERKRQQQLALRANEPRFFQLAVTGFLGGIRVSRDDEGSESDTARGIALGAAFYPLRRFALVSEVWWQYGDFGACTVDYACIRSLGKRHTVLSFGLRYQPTEAFSFDLAGAKHTTYIQQKEVHFSRESVMVLATAGWRAPVRPVDISVLFRVGTTNVKKAQVSTAVLGLQLGKSW